MKLTAKHMYLIQLLADPSDTRTQAEKAKDAGFTVTYVPRLYHEKDFLEALHAKTTEMVAAKRPQVYGNLLRDSGKGDTAAGVAYLKGAGDIQGGVNVHTNVTQNNEGSFADRLQEAQAARSERARNLRRVALEDPD
jgi:hypothetical protein